jgi:hypothetical protein
MSRAVPVISYARGCIEHIVTKNVGLAIQQDDNFFHNAISIIEEWLSCPVIFHEKSRMAFSEFDSRKNFYDAKMTLLCNELNTKAIS